MLCICFLSCIDETDLKLSSSFTSEATYEDNFGEVQDESWAKVVPDLGAVDGCADFAIGLD